MSTTLWFHWGQIAFDAERQAHEALAAFIAAGDGPEPTDALGRSFRASMTAIVAAALMVESLYGAVCYFVEPVTGGTRWTRILQTLRKLFVLDANRIRKLDQRMRDLFELRDDAAHPWIAVQPPRPHPGGVGNTSVEVTTYTPEAASQAIELALALLDQCSLYPVPGNRSARRWADRNRASVERLRSLRTTSTR